MTLRLLTRPAAAAPATPARGVHVTLWGWTVAVQTNVERDAFPPVCERVWGATKFALSLQATRLAATTRETNVVRSIVKSPDSCLQPFGHHDE
jgi:hypothetical protein